jgi:hypothetical protein
MKYKEKIFCAPIFESVNNRFVNSSIFWDITPFIQLKVNRLFGGKISSFYLLHAGFLLGLLFGPDDGGEMLLRNVSGLFSGLHGVISQKIKLFIIAAVRTSDPT